MIMRNKLLLGSIAILACLAADISEALAQIDEIIVTARRREESIQTVPVAIQAFSSEKLTSAGITSTWDLQKFVPGAIFKASGSPSNTTYYIRGQGRDVIGPGTPSVISYFNEVPLGGFATVLPTFDVDNVQVLKGPQGTLFGKNTTGGAVLVYSKAPTYDYEGYVEGLFGNHDWKEVQGALNIPIVEDTLAVRVAGNIQRRDGYTKELLFGSDKDELHNDSFRASVLFEPTDWLHNTTVYDYYHENTANNSNIPFGKSAPVAAWNVFPFAFAAFGAPTVAALVSTFDCGVSPSCDVDLYLDQAAQEGPRSIRSNNPTSYNAEIWGLSNTTVIDAGPVTIKNIFGLRTHQFRNFSNTDGIPFQLLEVESTSSQHTISEEIQFAGALFDDSLEWLVGAFYSRQKPSGANALKFDVFRPNGVPIDFWPLANVQNAMYFEKSKAVFGSLDYSFSDFLEGFGLNGSIRYTEDENSACANTVLPYSTPPIDGWDACQADPTATTVTGKFNKVTWQVGGSYEFTDDIFGYVTVREGYRAGHVNTPRLSPVLAQFQTFEPQSVRDYEIGLKANWDYKGVNGRFNISAFRNKFTDFQRAAAGLPQNLDGDFDSTNDPSNTTLVINGATASFKGIEIDGTISPIEDITISYGASYLYPKLLEATAEPLLGIGGNAIQDFSMAPRYSYTVGGEWRLPCIPDEVGDVVLSGEFYWVSDYVVGLAQFDSYGTGDARIEWRNIAGTGVTGTAFVNNISNNEYPSYPLLSGPSPGVLSGIYGPPRMYGVRLRFDFGPF